MGMDVDDAGQHEQPAGIDLARVGVVGQGRLDGRDAPTLDGNVGGAAGLGRDDGPAANDQPAAYATSSMTMSCAPSQSTSRPISLSCSRPAVMVAKWLPASWPSFDEKVTPP
jgi:hypothetical protein